MTVFSPPTGTDQEWKEAYDRLDDYLTAHSSISKMHRGELIFDLLLKAAERHAQDPSQSPTRLAMAEAYDRVDEWFQKVLGEDEIPLSRIANHGRVAMHMIDAPAKWPDVFLSNENVPGDFAEAMRGTSIRSGPDLRISAMSVRPLDVQPVTELFEEGWQKISRLGLSVVLCSVFASCAVLFIHLRHS